MTSLPTHFRKGRGNGWGTLTVSSCRINRRNGTTFRFMPEKRKNPESRYKRKKATAGPSTPFATHPCEQRPLAQNDKFLGMQSFCVCDGSIITRNGRSVSGRRAGISEQRAMHWLQTVQFSGKTYLSIRSERFASCNSTLATKERNAGSSTSLRFAQNDSR